jgi:putative hydrolase of the HAD superfamily
MADVCNQGILQRFELGTISDNEFMAYLKQHCSSNVTHLDIMQAWNAMLLDIPSARIHLINNLEKKYKLLLLSNTNHIHYLSYSKDFEKISRGKKLNEMFHHCYFSFEIHLRKPTIDIYKYLIQKEMLIPEETLFIDDNHENIETAMMMGIKTHWLQEELMDLFQKIKV